MKRWIAFAVLSSAIFLGAADQPANLVKNGDAESGTLDNWTGFTKVSTADPHSGKFCFFVQGSAIVQSNEFIPVDPTKTYAFSAWIKSLGKSPSVVFAGYAPYDKDKNPIDDHEVHTVAGTETTLIVACKADDKVLRIAEGSKWQLAEYDCVAFQVDDSGKYADLPNRKLSSYGIVKVANKGSYWEVQLQGPCGRAYPAGTKIREHSSGGTFIYNALVAQSAPAQWTECTGVLKGMAEAGAPQDQWWPGTKYARVVLLVNYGQTPDFSMAVDDVSVIAK